MQHVPSSGSSSGSSDGSNQEQSSFFQGHSLHRQPLPTVHHHRHRSIPSHHHNIHQQQHIPGQPLNFAHLLLSNINSDAPSSSRASSITSLGSSSSSEGEQEDDEDEGSLDIGSVESDDDDRAGSDRGAISSLSSVVEGRPTAASPKGMTDQARHAASNVASSQKALSKRRRVEFSDAPPRLADLFPSSRSLRIQASQAVATAAASPTRDEADNQGIRKKRRKVCFEPNCCGDAELQLGDRNLASDVSRVHHLFWQRQVWLVKNRGADGLSHCDSDEEKEPPDEEGADRRREPERAGLASGTGELGEGHKDERLWSNAESTDVVRQQTADDRENKEPTPPSMVMQKHKRPQGLSEAAARKSSHDGRLSMPAKETRMLNTAASHEQVLRTAGAGLPLARVKRVMKSADDEIKMISHEAPSLLSRLCTVLIADLSVRAGRNALTQGRRTISSRDLLEVTVGSGEGSGTEWEFLRDVVAGKDD
ncbi:unnamed protein product [Sympodiomycopsis kandeliae]